MTAKPQGWRPMLIFDDLYPFYAAGDGGEKARNGDNSLQKPMKAYKADRLFAHTRVR
jgi:hypothetical protein